MVPNENIITWESSEERINENYYTQNIQKFAMSS